MSARWFIGDLHFGHERVSEIRGFTSTDEHDTAIIKDWCASVRDDDTVFVLGDLCGGSAHSTERALTLMASLPGVKHLIAGNHDAVSSVHRDGWKHQRRYLNVFESVRDFGRIRSLGMGVLMSHYPYPATGDGPERAVARYMEYRLPDTGLPLIHAHTHQSEPVSANPRELCVSWDAWRRMVGQKDIDTWLTAVKEATK